LRVIASIVAAAVWNELLLMPATMPLFVRWYQLPEQIEIVS